MKWVGEVMAVGRSFAESLQKARRGLGTGLAGLDPVELPGTEGGEIDRQRVMAALSEPTSDRLLNVAQALRAGMSIEEVHAACRIDPWFLARRSAERRVGKGCDSTCRSRGQPKH